MLQLSGGIMASRHFPASRLLEAAEGAARTQGPLQGQLMRLGRSPPAVQRQPLGSFSNQEHIEQCGQTGHGASVVAWHGSLCRQG